MFDEIIIWDEDAPVLRSDEARIDKMIWAKRALRPLEDFKALKCQVGAASWMRGLHGDAIIFRETASEEATTLLLRRNPEGVSIEPNPTGEPDPILQAAGTGVILNGQLQHMHMRGASRAKFLLIKEDDDLLRSLADAAKTEVYARLVGGFTGLEL
jgi:hypothetical protein